MECLNTCSIGAKANKETKDLETFHATFSSIKYSQLVNLWNIQAISRWDKNILPICEIHEHHDNLQPYFMINRALQPYIDKLCASGHVSERKCIFTDYQTQLQTRLYYEKDQ